MRLTFFIPAIRVAFYLVTLAHMSESHSSMVPCTTELQKAGHGCCGVTTPGGGVVVLSRGGSLLACGSSLSAGESLTIAVQGTSGAQFFDLSRHSRL